MTERRVLSRGAIRVDARRAAEKLREHLLVDLHGYTLEVARASIALGATTLDVRWDSDDVQLVFDGRCIAPERLPRLFDFALSDDADESARALRPLALGLNAALGLGVSFIDVYSWNPAASRKVRLDAELFADGDAGSSGLEAVEARPPFVPFPEGTFIHVHAKLSLGVLRRAISSERPTEVSRLLDHIEDAPLVLKLAGAVVERAPRDRVLARVPFLLPGASRAVVELLPLGSSPRIEVLEHGIRLLTLPWLPLRGLESAGDLALPFRVRVDAPVLPTNASRSALLEDAPLCRELGPAANEAFKKCLAALIARVTGEAPVEGVELVAGEPELVDALETLACLAAHASGQGGQLAGEVRAILDVPLLERATGGRLPLSGLLALGKVDVWTGDQPLEPELAPWLSDVVSLRGRRVERALQGLVRKNAADLSKRRAARRSAPGALPRPRPASAPSAARRAGGVAAAVSSRERAEWWPSRRGRAPGSGLAQLAPGVRRGPDARSAAHRRGDVSPRLRRSRGVAGEPQAPLRLRRRRTGRPLEPGPLRGEPRRAGAGGAQRRGSTGVPRRPGRARAPPQRAREFLQRARTPRDAGADRRHVRARLPELWAARVLPTSDRARTSLAALSDYARKMGAVCVVSPEELRAPARAPDGRPVLVARGAALDHVFGLMPGGTERVPYAKGLAASGLDAQRESALRRALADERARQGLNPAGPVMEFERDGALHLAMPGLDAATIEAHAGVLLETRRRSDAKVPLLLAVDDARSMPNSAWNGLANAPTRATGWFEERLTGRLLDALDGDPEALAALGLSRPPDVDASLAAFLLARLAALRSRAGGARNDAAQKRRVATAERIAALPLVRALDAGGRPIALSVDALVERHGAAIPLLSAIPGFETLDWQPVVPQSETERAVLAQIFPAAVGAEPELVSRKQAAERHAELLALRALEPRPLAELSPRALPSDSKSELLPDSSNDLHVVVALPSPNLAPGEPWVELHFEGRPCARLRPSEVGLPLVANVGSSNFADFRDLVSKSPRALERVGARLVQASGSLLFSLAEKERGLLVDTRALKLALALFDLGHSELMRELLIGRMRYPTVQGGSGPLESLARAHGQLLFGSHRYSTWLPPSGLSTELDQPILHLPSGELGALLGVLLSRLGHERTNVTAELELLQEKRGGAPKRGPELDGLPAHPLLRSKLLDLGVTLAEGELELWPETRSAMAVELLGGRTESFSIDLDPPARAVARVDALNLDAVRHSLSEALVEAARSLLVRAVARLEEQPAFVRNVARRTLCRVASTRRDPVLSNARVFVDTQGAFHRITDFAGEKQLFYTTLGPPFPSTRRRVLCLPADEATGLADAFRMVCADASVQNTLAAERRRNAPPVAHVGLSAEQRAACMLTSTVRAENTTGEVGVLAPGHVEQRAGSLYVGGRLLCELEQGAGWPLVFALEDGSVAPNMMFDGPQRKELLPLLVDRARSAALEALRRTLAGASGALASRFLTDEVAGEFHVTGTLWFPAELPRLPTVRIHVAGHAVPFVRPMEIQREPWPLQRALPLEGDLLVHPEGGAERGTSTLARLEALDFVWSALAELGQRVAVELLASARGLGTSPVTDAYAVQLALLGLDVEAPLRDAMGAVRTARELLDELESPRGLWLADARGFAEGRFPGQAPAFFLADDGGPLVTVLALRAPEGSLHRLGSVEADVRATPSPAAVVGFPPLPVAEPDSLWSRVTAGLNRALATPEVVLATRPEHRALAERLAELQLTGSPVMSLVLAKAKRAIRYDAERRCLLLDPSHPVLAELLGSPDAAASLVAAAHAVCEVNRALSDVTDGEEQRALSEFLKQLRS
ncbi:MAG: hypothetical protein U0263_02820 [Polyangiaceae bacterium]